MPSGVEVAEFGNLLDGIASGCALGVTSVETANLLDQAP